MRVNESKCANSECKRDHTPRSNYCQPCRASLRRWINMSAAERAASKDRAFLRWQRVVSFRASFSRIRRVKRFSRVA